MGAICLYVRRFLFCKDYALVEELQDQASIAQGEENECHFKVGFSAELLVQQEAVEQVKKLDDKFTHSSLCCNAIFLFFRT